MADWDVGAQSLQRFFCVLKFSRWFVPTQFTPLKKLYNGLTTEGGAMSRSRSYNRFHRYLARQKRRGLRSVLPQYQMEFEYYGTPIDHSQDMLNRLKGREIELELLEAQA